MRYYFCIFQTSKQKKVREIEEEYKAFLNAPNLVCTLPNIFSLFVTLKFFNYSLFCSAFLCVGHCLIILFLSLFQDASQIALIKDYLETPGHTLVWYHSDIFEEYCLAVFNTYSSPQYPIDEILDENLDTIPDQAKDSINFLKRDGAVFKKDRATILQLLLEHLQSTVE